jgi:2'-5' RNA ligase
LQPHDPQERSAKGMDIPEEDTPHGVYLGPYDHIGIHRRHHDIWAVDTNQVHLHHDPDDRDNFWGFHYSRHPIPPEAMKLIHRAGEPHEGAANPDSASWLTPKGEWQTLQGEHAQNTGTTNSASTVPFMHQTGHARVRTVQSPRGYSSLNVQMVHPLTPHQHRALVEESKNHTHTSVEVARYHPEGHHEDGSPYMASKAIFGSYQHPPEEVGKVLRKATQVAWDNPQDDYSQHEAVLHQADQPYQGGHKFRFIPATPKQMNGNTFHELRAFPEGTPDHLVNHPNYYEMAKHSSGSIAWDHKSGEITGVAVQPEHQRQGLATELLHRARQIAETTRGVKPPRHSDDRTDQGEQWARSLGERLPKRNAGVMPEVDAEPHTGADGEPHTGVMACFVIPEAIAKDLAVKGGEEASELHCTIAYMGKASEVDEDALHSAVMEFVGSHGPMEGTLSGFGDFSVDPEYNDGFEHCQIGLMSIPHISIFRSDLERILDNHGIKVDNKFGLQPHCSIAYSHEPMQYEEMPPVTGEPIQFNDLTIAYGGTWRHYHLG